MKMVRDSSEAGHSDLFTGDKNLQNKKTKLKETPQSLLRKNKICRSVYT